MWFTCGFGDILGHLIFCAATSFDAPPSAFWTKAPPFGSPGHVSALPGNDGEEWLTMMEDPKEYIYICILWPKSWNIGGNERPYTGLEIIMKSFYIDSPKIHPRWYRFAASEGWGRSPSCRMRKGSALRLHSIEKNVMLPGKSLEGVVWINMV